MLLLKMRKGIFSYIFLGFLVLGTVSLVLSDSTGTLRGIQGSSDVAVIGDKAIKTGEFDRMVRRIAGSQNMNTADAYKMGLVDQILEVTIMDHLLKQAASDYGVVIDDRHVAKQINDLVTPMAGKDGDKKQTLARILQSQNMSEGELVDNLRDSMATTILRDAVTQNAYVPAALAADLHKYQNEQRTAEAVLLPMAGADDGKAPTDEELKAYFETVRERFTAPENRSFTVAILDPESFSKKTAITDEDVKAYYDDNQDSFHVSERRILDQVVLDDEQLSDKVIKAARDGKKPLKDALKSVTNDTKGYMPENGFEKTGLPQELADSIFSAQAGSYVGPIKSPLGWHVIHVKSVEAPRVEPFDKVKVAIRKQLEDASASEEIYAEIDALDQRLANGEPLADIAKEAKLKLISLKDVRMSQPDFPELKDYEADEPRILQSASNLEEGQTSPFADMSTGKMYAIHLDGTQPRRQKELSEVKDEVKAMLLGDRLAKANAAYAQQAMEKLTAGKTTLADIAKEKKTKVQSFAGITRTSKAPAGLSEGNVRIIMNGEQGKYLIMPADKGLMIARVTKVTLPEKAPTDKEGTDIRQMTGTELSQENLLTFMDDLQRHHKVVKNEPLIERMYGEQPQEGR